MGPRSFSFGIAVAGLCGVLALLAPLQSGAMEAWHIRSWLPRASSPVQVDCARPAGGSTRWVCVRTEGSMECTNRTAGTITMRLPLLEPFPTAPSAVAPHIASFLCPDLELE